MGTTGKAISLRVQSLTAQAFKVVKQIETPYLPDPIMRLPEKPLGADREEKRVTHGNEQDRSAKRTQQEKLDLNDPNQRRLSG